MVDFSFKNISGLLSRAFTVAKQHTLEEKPDNTIEQIVEQVQNGADINKSARAIYAIAENDPKQTLKVATALLDTGYTYFITLIGQRLEQRFLTLPLAEDFDGFLDALDRYKDEHGDYQAEHYAAYIVESYESTRLIDPKKIYANPVYMDALQKTSDRGYQQYRISDMQKDLDLAKYQDENIRLG